MRVYVQTGGIPSLKKEEYMSRIISEDSVEENKSNSNPFLHQNIRKEAFLSCHCEIIRSDSVK